MERTDRLNGLPLGPERVAPIPALEIQRTRTALEACSVLLRFAVEEWGAPRIAVMSRAESELRGYLQRGFDAPVTRVTVDLDTVDHALQRPLRHPPVSGVVRVEPTEELPFGFDSLLVFPITSVDGDLVAAVVADAEHFEGESERFVAILAECAPAMSRVVELEELGLRYEQSHRRQKLLSLMVHSLPDPVLLTDEYNRIVLSNRRADALLVSQPEDTEGRRRAVGLNNLFFTSHLTEALVTGSDRVGVSELDLTDPVYGADLSFEVLTFPVSRAEDLQATRITVLRDITDLKKALRELEDQISQSRVQEHRAVRESARLQAIIESAGKPILVTDQSSKIVLMNPDAERLLEPPSKDADSRVSARAVRDNHAHITGVLSEFLLAGTSRQTRRAELRDPYTGESLPVDVVSSVIVGDRGEVTAVVSILRDLRPVVVNERLARELRELNERLEVRVREATAQLEERHEELKEQARVVERASKAKSEFLASVSHELRTPINAILGYTALIQERIYGTLTADQERALEKVERSSKHLLALISDILDLSTIEAGRLPMASDEFTVRQLVREIEETIAPMVHEAGLDFHKEVSGGDVCMTTDRTRLQQVLFNLLTNAVKYTDEGSVTFRTFADEDGVRFEVEDTGIGIGEDEIEDVFESFTQSVQTREDHRGGAGLGLAISRRLAEMMQGTLEVSSTLGEGSIFTLRVPRKLRPSRTSSSRSEQRA